ncbi:MAG: 50S ribosomal protein L23 [Dissulfurimicrobium sp.]|uniref:50S ribosomal protein L23 n=1 Tax=Dissulfurimicrobium TaxID=1769732 RepID=UPI001EDACF5F|nr:50S ribosomal protein L23 [Dissulfurimicrobium hydrothermale]UKL14322.1 50S ribosomal protein L23 [Dissulfurimicrobium hydrothermale]
MRDLYSVIHSPLLTEKATFQKELGNQVVFRVDRCANKIEIKRAVEQLFKVKVQDVQTAVIKGKTKRVGRFHGRRADTKKAVVRLRPGDTIDFFSEV